MNHPTEQGFYQRERELPEAWPPLKTEIAEIGIYADKLEEMLIKLGWPKGDVMEMESVFREWVANAMIHGNMGIARQKGEGNEHWDKRLGTASSLPSNKAKHVYVNITATRSSLVIEIQDEGKNTEPFWLEKERHDSLKDPMQWFSGRGGVITLNFVNESHFEKNRTGVKVTFVRDLDREREIDSVANDVV